MVTISSIVRLTLFVILIVLIVTQNSSKLVMMQQVHRHGARYPIYPRADDNSTYAHTEHSTG